ncbi:hypothetical protein DV736_g4332, partial [Chaetothyriales sp. CBS 134916]
MPKRLVLTELPIPRDQISLGSFVCNLKHPNLDAHNSVAPSLDDIHTSSQTGYSSLVRLRRTTSFRPHLAVFGLDLTEENDVGLILEATKGLLYELKNPTDLFQRVCQNPQTQRWLQDAEDARKDIYFITGLRSLFDARVRQGNKHSAAHGVEIDVPLDAVASGAAVGIPLSLGGDVGMQVGRDSSCAIGHEFRAPGEQIYAVQYRRVKVKFFRSRDATPQALEHKVCWKDILVARSQPGDVDMVEAETFLSLLLSNEFETIEIESGDEEYLVFEN